MSTEPNTQAPARDFVLRPADGTGPRAAHLALSLSGRLGVQGTAAGRPQGLRILRRDANGLLVALWGERVVSGIVRSDQRAVRVFSEAEGIWIDLRLSSAAIDRMEQAASSSAETGGTLSICSPIPGLIRSIPVRPGEQISAGQTVAVLEAMKMENEINSPKGGIILTVEVKEGQTVGGGELLMKLET